MGTELIDTKTSCRVSSEAYLIPLGYSDPTPVKISSFFTIGRDHHNALRIADPFISGQHARIDQKDGQWVIRDLQSRNGTFLNGTRVVEGILQLNDTLRVGEREFLFQHHPTSPTPPSGLTSKNSRWQHQLASLPIFSRTNLPVLLLGPSGTGKDVLARQIHEYSQRSKMPFVSVNCSALSESLVESELFGHVRGSFTGATNNRKGAFETARGGTLFLDEIGDLPIALQPKLLRALENREIRPVGSDQVISTDVRVIAATHHNLQHKIQLNQFRADLFYRLNVVRFNIPPLCERFEDFEDLLFEFAKEMKVQFSVPAIERMKYHSWPGNIRELKNVVARASGLFSGLRIQADHIAQLIDSTLLPTPNAHNEALGQDRRINAPRNGNSVIKELEKEMIKTKLIAHKGNQRQAAMELNMPKSTFHDKVRAYDIDIKAIREMTQGL